MFVNNNRMCYVSDFSFLDLLEHFGENRFRPTLCWTVAMQVFYVRHFLYIQLDDQLRFDVFDVCRFSSQESKWCAVDTADGSLARLRHGQTAISQDW